MEEKSESEYEPDYESKSEPESEPEYELESKPEFEETIVEIVRKGLKQTDTTDMPDLESEESAEQRRKKKRQGLQILTPDEILSRLPITLVQLKAGNNSRKFKNEIRQLLYSFYRSKKLTKTIYNNLINTI